MIGPIAASFMLCLLAMFALRPLAIALKFIDRPGGRKTHQGDVPVVGGLAMLLGIAFGMGFVPLSETASTSFLAACALLVTVGLVDDRFDLSPWTRLPAQVAAALLLIAGSNAAVSTLGAPFGEAEVLLSGFGSYAFTVLIIVASINAFNMLDGMDGLAGAMGFVALSALVFLALDAGAFVPAASGLVIIGALTAFLISNVPVRFNRDVRCFMGDSGSTLLGLAVAWLCIGVSQHPANAAAPVTLLWVVALPLFDFLWTILRRALRGSSPLRGDSEHLHHLVLRAGFGVRGAFLVFAILATLLAVIGITMDRLGIADSTSLMLLAMTGVLVVRLMYSAHVLHAWLPESWKGAAMPGTGDREADLR